MGSIIGLGANLALEDARALVKQLITSNTVDQALLQFEQIQIDRANRFMEMECKQKKFLLHGNREDYSKFWSFLKKTNSMEFHKDLIDAMLDRSNAD